MLLPVAARLSGLRIPIQSYFRRQCTSVRMPSALVILSEGAEEMETVITVDVLRRGGIDVTVAGLTSSDPVTCSRGVVIKPDTSLDDASKNSYDAIICPGGMGGAKNLAGSSAVGELLKKQESEGKYVACICAACFVFYNIDTLAPIALKSHKIGTGKTITSHPVVGEELREAGYKYSEDRVVVDGTLVTSRGPGTCFEFALALVEKLQSKEKKESIIPPMLLKL